MESREFEVKTLMDTHMPEDKVCVLWLVWKDGKTQSLGVLSDNVGKTMMKLPKNMQRKTEMAEVAVSVEKAGEKMEEPQGEIMFKGPWVEL